VGAASTVAVPMTPPARTLRPMMTRQKTSMAAKPASTMTTKISNLKDWGVIRTYTDGDSWTVTRAELAKCGIQLLQRDVDHNGDCKMASAVVALRDAQEDAPDPRKRKQTPLTKKTTPDNEITRLRSHFADKLTWTTLETLKRTSNSNYGDWLRVCVGELIDVKNVSNLTAERSKTMGYSMAPVWPENWEMSQICSEEKVVCIELHNATASNQNRSHVQLVMPTPDHTLSGSDNIIVLRRMQCHYNPVWVWQHPWPTPRSRMTLAELPEKFRAHFSLNIY
jgi:hypothetical protein